MAEPDCILPRGIYKRGDSLAINYRVHGKRVRRTVGPISVDEAVAIRNRLISETKRLHPWTVAGRRNAIATVRGSAWENPGRWMRPYFLKVINNAAARGISVELTLEESIQLLIETGGRCSLSGLPFSAEKADGWRIAPYRPSLDRIDSSMGYSATNCRWICAAANVALSDYGESVFKRLSVAYVARLLEMEK